MQANWMEQQLPEGDTLKCYISIPREAGGELLSSTLFHLSFSAKNRWNFLK
jgi:hypothetical protein